MHICKNSLVFPWFPLFYVSQLCHGGFRLPSFNATFMRLSVFPRHLRMQPQSPYFWLCYSFARFVYFRTVFWGSHVHRIRRYLCISKLFIFRGNRNYRTVHYATEVMRYSCTSYTIFTGKHSHNIHPYVTFSVFVYVYTILQASTVTIFILMLLLCGIRVCRIPSPETATITISRGICVFPNCKLDTHRTSSCSLCSKYAVYPTPAVPRLCSLCSKYAVHPTPAVPRLCSLSSKYAVHPTPAVPRLCSLCSKYK